MGFTVKEVQPTPNPNAMKYLLDGEIVSERQSFHDAASAHSDPLASQFFAVAGVSGILLLGDFVTVTKSPDAKWSSITPKVKKLLAGMV